MGIKQHPQQLHPHQYCSILQHSELQHVSTCHAHVLADMLLLSPIHVRLPQRTCNKLALHHWAHSISTTGFNMNSLKNLDHLQLMSFTNGACNTKRSVFFPMETSTVLMFYTRQSNFYRHNLSIKSGLRLQNVIPVLILFSHCHNHHHENALL